MPNRHAWRAAGLAVRGMHNLPVDGFGVAASGLSDTLGSMLRPLVDRIGTRLGDRDTARLLAHENDILGGFHRPVMVHGGLPAGLVFNDLGDFSGISRPAAPFFGPAGWDLATIRASSLPEEAKRSFMDGYGTGVDKASIHWLTLLLDCMKKTGIAFPEGGIP